jgi:hypothetical protein
MMALVDVSFLCHDPDFADAGELITRQMTVNEWGEGELVESAQTIVASFQPATGEDLQRLPEAAHFSDVIVVYYAGELSPERAGGYADVVKWRGRRYQVKSADPWGNYGVGYWRAVCLLEPAHA